MKKIEPKIKSALYSWYEIEMHNLSTVRREFFSEYNEDEFNLLLHELKLIKKDGKPSKRAFVNIILTSLRHNGKLLAAIHGGYSWMAKEYIIFSQKGIDYLKEMLEKKKAA